MCSPGEIRHGEKENELSPTGRFRNVSDHNATAAAASQKAPGCCGAQFSLLLPREKPAELSASLSRAAHTQQPQAGSCVCSKAQLNLGCCKGWPVFGLAPGGDLAGKGWNSGCLAVSERGKTPLPGWQNRLEGLGAGRWELR